MSYVWTGYKKVQWDSVSNFRTEMEGMFYLEYN